MVNSILVKVFPGIISVGPICLTTRFREFFQKLVKDCDEDLVELIINSNKIEY
jgi:hypothetical protein